MHSAPEMTELEPGEQQHLGRDLVPGESSLLVKTSGVHGDWQYKIYSRDRTIYSVET